MEETTISFRPEERKLLDMFLDDIRKTGLLKSSKAEAILLWSAALAKQVLEGMSSQASASSQASTSSPLDIPGIEPEPGLTYNTVRMRIEMSQEEPKSGAFDLELPTQDLD